MSVEIIQGDCLTEMPKMEANSIDAIVTDPPYGLSFMGKDWDHGIPGMAFWREALRVAKPGAHLLAFGGTRTFHRLACAIEDAGWEIRDCIMWVYGSGFPKSLDVSKAIDKAAGAKRRVVGPNPNSIGRTTNMTGGRLIGGHMENREDCDVLSAPATDAACQWSGWGTALKPAWEPVILARKPLEGTVAANVQKWGTGAVNIDGCRVESGGTHISAKSAGMGRGHGTHQGHGKYHGVGGVIMPPHPQGRFPANLIHDGSDEVVGMFPESKSTGGINGGKLGKRIYGKFKNEIIGTNAGGLGDSGSAARFFYCAKASKADRDEGCEQLPERTAGACTDRDEGTAGLNSPRAGAGRTSGARNHHPTVKPTSLMRYLCRLVTPPGGIVLDPFMGSGSTGKAAILEGFNFIGVEISAEYIEIARARIAHAEKQESEKQEELF